MIDITIIIIALHDPRELTTSVLSALNTIAPFQDLGAIIGDTLLQTCAESGNAGLKRLTLKLGWREPPHTNRGGSGGSVLCWSHELPPGCRT